MAQRKKKQSAQSIQKIAQAHYKNEFMRQIRELLLFFLKPELFAQLPPKEFDFLYNLRYNIPIIVSAPGHKIPNDMLKLTRIIFSHYWKVTEVPLVKEGPSISIHNCLTLWMTIFTYFQGLTDNNFPNSGKVKEALRPHMEIDEKIHDLLDHIYGLAQSICVINSDIGERLYWMKYDIILNDANYKFQNKIEIYCETPERRNITIDGNNRPIIRFGWWELFATNISWLTIKPAQLKIDTPDPEMPIGIYFQSHALQRLAERLDGIETWLIHLSAYKSLSDPQIIPSGFGYPLIEYRIGEIRAGYFTYIIVDGILLIRTFLFIINNGTPEGKKLQEVTGLGRLDKKYLAIDKISSFISSDIGENETVKNILIQCDCESLLHLNEEVGKPFFCTKGSSQRTAELMERYLQRPTQEEGYMRYLNISV